MVRKTIFETKYDLRGGHGPVHFNHIMKGDELMGHGTAQHKHQHPNRS